MKFEKKKEGQSTIWEAPGAEIRYNPANCFSSVGGDHPLGIVVSSASFDNATDTRAYRDTLTEAIAEAEKDSRMVTVCDKCLMASCWNGIHMCQESQNAGIVDKPISELKLLGREHPSYWEVKA